MEQKEWETIEDEIAELEEKISLLQEEMNHQGDNFTRLQNCKTTYLKQKHNLKKNGTVGILE